MSKNGVVGMPTVISDELQKAKKEALTSATDRELVEELRERKKAAVVKEIERRKSLGQTSMLLANSLLNLVTEHSHSYCSDGNRQRDFSREICTRCFLLEAYDHGVWDDDDCVLDIRVNRMVSPETAVENQYG